MTLLGHTTAAIVSDGSVDASWIGSSLPLEMSYRTLDLVGGAARTIDALAEAPPELLVLAATTGDRLLEVVVTARERLPGAAIVIVDGESPNGYLQRAFAAGADDLVTLPQTRESLVFALEKAVARRRRGSTRRTLGRMICVVGPKGGTGKTLTACNLAVALALAGARPVLVDLDLQFGDVGLALGLAPERTLHDVAAGGRVDEGRLDDVLAVHASGAKALLAPVRPDHAAAVSPDLLRSLFPVLRELHDVVVVDTPPAFGPEVIAAIDASTDLCMVGTLDALSLKDTKVGLETLELMGHDPASVRLVLNRADSKVGITEADVAEILGRKPDVLVPSDRLVPRTLTRGIPIVLDEPKSGPARAFLALAALYHEPPAAARRRRGPVAALLGRSGR